MAGVILEAGELGCSLQAATWAGVLQSVQAAETGSPLSSSPLPHLAPLNAAGVLQRLSLNVCGVLACRPWGDSSPEDAAAMLPPLP